jgi:hypothetical protein
MDVLEEGWARTTKYAAVKHFFREREGLKRSLCGNYGVIGLEDMETDGEMYGKCPLCLRLRAVELKKASQLLLLGAGAM